MKKITGGIILASLFCLCTGIKTENLKKEAETLVSRKTKEQLNTMNEYCRMKGKEFDMKKEEAIFKKEQIKSEMVQNKTFVWRELAVTTIPDLSQTIVKYGIGAITIMLGIYLFKKGTPNKSNNFSNELL